MIVHLIDGTYELFRHFYGLRSFNKGNDKPFGAVAGVLHSVLEMLETGATHIGVATDHVIESFRNDLWADYKTGEGIEPVLYSQFIPLEESLVAMGVTTFAMVELEADDALASAAHIAAQDKRVEKVCIWTPDKDLAQCVVGERVVQVDRKSGNIRDEQAVRAKFGVAPEFIADYLALVGDAADGYPGLAGCGPKTAVSLISRHGHIEDFPDAVLGPNRERALLFKDLATLRSDAPLFRDVDELRWTGATDSFPAVAAKIGDPRLADRMRDLAARLVIALLLLICLPPSVRAQGVEAMRVSGSALELDGRLSEDVWRSAPPARRFLQREPNEGAPAADSTEVRFAYDASALWIGARMYSRKASDIRALVTRRDREGSSEQIIVSLDTHRDRRTAYTFSVTPAGVPIDYFHAGDFETQRNYDYDPVWEAETAIDSAGWTAEIRIPFTQLRFNPGEAQRS